MLDLDDHSASHLAFRSHFPRLSGWLVRSQEQPLFAKTFNREPLTLSHAFLSGVFFLGIYIALTSYHPLTGTFTLSQVLRPLYALRLLSKGDFEISHRDHPALTSFFHPRAFHSLSLALLRQVSCCSSRRTSPAPSRAVLVVYLFV